MNGSVFPACFEDLKQFADWRASARVSPDSLHPCLDCTPEFRERMKSQGRCDPERVKRRFRSRPPRAG